MTRIIRLLEITGPKNALKHGKMLESVFALKRLGTTTEGNWTTPIINNKRILLAVAAVTFHGARQDYRPCMRRTWERLGT